MGAWAKSCDEEQCEQRQCRGCRKEFQAAGNPSCAMTPFSAISTEPESLEAKPSYLRKQHALRKRIAEDAIVAWPHMSAEHDLGKEGKSCSRQ